MSVMNQLDALFPSVRSTRAQASRKKLAHERVSKPFNTLIALRNRSTIGEENGRSVAPTRAPDGRVARRTCNGDHQPGNGRKGEMEFVPGRLWNAYGNASRRSLSRSQRGAHRRDS